MSRVLTLVAAALLLAGALVGLLPVQAQGVSCGNAFHASSDADVADFSRAIEADQSGVSLDGSLTSASDACSDARSGRRTPAIVLLVLGGIASAAAYGAWAREREQPTS